MKVFDVHTHAGGKNYSHNDAEYDSNVNEYNNKIKNLDDARVEKTIAFAQPRPYEWLKNYNPTPSVNFESANDKVAHDCENYSGMLFAAFTDARDYKAGDEINRCIKKYDVKALKVHLGTHNTNPEHLNRNGIINCAGEHNLPIIMHASCEHFNELENIIKSNPDINVVIAHMGYLMNELTKIVKNYDNAYFDTSAFTHNNFKISIVSALLNEKSDLLKQILSPYYEAKALKLPFKVKTTQDLVEWLLTDEIIKYSELIKTAVEFIGPEKILFGSDEGWCPIMEQLEIIKNSPIKESDKEKIFYKNFETIMK